MSNILTSYPILNDELRESLDYRIDISRVTYKKSGVENKLELKINQENEFYIEDEALNWNPLEHNIKFDINIIFNNKNILFDEYIGLVDADAKIGIALTWFCKSTNQIKTIPIGELNEFDLNYYENNFQLEFDAGELKDKINLKFILFLKELGINSYIGQRKGCVFGELDEFVINLEGDGSVFPIEIIQDKKQLLWMAKFKYDEIREDLFNKEHVCLYLNKAHKDFLSLNLEAEELSPMLKEILANFIYMFLIDLKENHVNLDEILTNQNDCEEYSIASVVCRWVQEFNIDLSSSYKMQESIRRCINDI